jgi:hypothetical protein
VIVARAAWLVGAVGLVALTLRVVGLQYGLPEVYNPDEVAIMARALSFAKGSLNPHNFLYPTFYFYVLFAWVGAYLAFLLVTGRVGSVGELQQLYFTNPAGLYTAGRAARRGGGDGGGAASCTGSARQAGGSPRAGHGGDDLPGGRARSPSIDAHYVKHDVPATLAIVDRVPRHGPGLACRRRRAGRARRDVVLAGAACGVAFSTHYYCVFLALPLALGRRPGSERRSRVAARRAVRRPSAAGCERGRLLCAVTVPAGRARRPPGATSRPTARSSSTGPSPPGAFAPAVRYLEMLWFDAMGHAGRRARR